jgi:nitroreductase
METWDAITTRRQTREFGDGPVDEQILVRILDAARRAPSARNRQRWDVVIVQDSDRIERLSHVWQGAAWVVNAPVVMALIVPEASHDERAAIRFDLGQMAMLLMIAATDAGLASGQANCADQDLARHLLGLPSEHECAMLLALGHPRGGPMQPIRHLNRRALDEMVHHERW